MRLPLIIIGRGKSNTGTQLRQLADLLNQINVISLLLGLLRVGQFYNFIFTLKVTLSTLTKHRYGNEEEEFKLLIKDRGKSRKLQPDKSREIGSGQWRCYETSGRTRAELKKI